jgi:hypothetical protein
VVKCLNLSSFQLYSICSSSSTLLVREDSYPEYIFFFRFYACVMLAGLQLPCVSYRWLIMCIFRLGMITRWVWMWQVQSQGICKYHIRNWPSLLGLQEFYLQLACRRWQVR